VLTAIAGFGAIAIAALPSEFHLHRGLALRLREEPPIHTSRHLDAKGELYLIGAQVLSQSTRDLCGRLCYYLQSITELTALDDVVATSLRDERFVIRLEENLSLVRETIFDICQWSAPMSAAAHRATS